MLFSVLESTHLFYQFPSNQTMGNVCVRSLQIEPHINIPDGWIVDNVPDLEGINVRGIRNHWFSIRRHPS